MLLLIGPVGGRWLNNTIGNVTIVLILLLKPKLSMAVDRLPSFFIHKTAILSISSKRTFLTLALQPIKPFMHGKLAETINKMSVNCTSLFFFLSKKGGKSLITVSVTHKRRNDCSGFLTA